ncbi:hypothetical protein Pmar_PMAR003335 [Perkinsus marinus ATCC 50983]|uniref:Uncharacterized protein n=1 Tax=Perkinsus marinus (strain ATCC 50983 / TXsc) TaxID=423536 RepID=C5KH17_PERM5|nr:hypothetical protein Pmar_PMAR003335 [Perkinsus marinus ATCC 50983]EER15879.1 hypothetical protein Pmar_PMAR003335 [Perkinsus marinus ATCC 50983]|eukprot:XP_002784083.1 hypothetical protein Pmar_PMAR003335 [Perkinsus marinus ATCC 50983]
MTKVRRDQAAWRLAAALEEQAAEDKAASAEADIERAEGIPQLSSKIEEIRAKGLQTEALVKDVIALDETLRSDATTEIEEAFPYTKVQRSVFGKTITIDSGIGFNAKRSG